VKVINTDGMAFIGPGSEWFWTALSGIVLAVTFIAIYRQLRLQRSQAAIDWLDKSSREYGSERMVRCKLEVLTAIRDGVDRAHLPGAFAEPMAIHWEDIGNAVRSGHMGARIVWLSHSNQAQFAWGLLSPTIRRWRAGAESDTLFEHFEWLATTMAEMDRRANVTDNAFEDLSADELEGSIVKFQSQIRMQEALRTVIIASPEAIPAAPPATAAAIEA
jgi:hypothetical protein